MTDPADRQAPASRTVAVHTKVCSPIYALVLALIVIAPLAGQARDSSLKRPLPVPQRCAAAPDACGFPDAANTGVAAGTALKAVPTRVSSGSGWSYVSNGSSSYVKVSGNGASLSDLYIPCSLEISASNVTINDVRVITNGYFGISLRNTANVTIENSTIAGRNTTSGRVDSAIDDIYGDSTGTIIKNDNIYDFRTGIMLSAGLIRGNYVHQPGFIIGDHTNGIYVDGSNRSLAIIDNTVINPLEQTDAIILAASGAGQTLANKTIEGNLVAGGCYAIYAGANQGNTTSHIVIKNNWFSQRYYDRGGLYGPATGFDPSGTGNVWSGNVWAGRPMPGTTMRGTTMAGIQRLARVPAP
jgi:hypothetical protein